MTANYRGVGEEFQKLTIIPFSLKTCLSLDLPRHYYQIYLLTLHRFPPDLAPSLQQRYQLSLTRTTQVVKTGDSHNLL